MRMAVAAGMLAGAAVLGLGGAAGAHHLGVYLPKDDEITASFKRMKVFLEKRRADLLQREFAEDRWVQRRMAEVDARYASTLMADMERALAAQNIADAERTLVRLFCFVSSEKVQEAAARLARADLPAGQKAEQGVKLLAAAWRYYNLVDFRVSGYAPAVASGAKVAFENAEYYLGKSSKGQAAFDEPKARDAMGKFQDLMAEFLAMPAPSGAEARRP